MFKAISNWYYSKPDCVKEDVEQAVSPEQPKEPDIVVPDISEPVISFVKTVKEDHRRFRFKKEYIDGMITYSCHSYYMIDRKLDTQDEISTLYVCIELFYGYDCSFTTKVHECRGTGKYSWLTDDEALYIYHELKDFYDKRKDRLIELKQIRTEKTNARNRQKYIDIYCVRRNNE